jgi:hypothetical protein
VNGFLNTVPKPVRTACAIIVFLGALIGLIAGGAHGMGPGRMQGIDMLAGVCIGLAAGCVLAIWVLCLGYVYADARRRAMPGALWVVVAVLVPNLLGFLLYFVLRRPISSPCPRCGRPVASDQRFCSWCGYEAGGFPAGVPPSPPAQSSPAL